MNRRDFLAHGTAALGCATLAAASDDDAISHAQKLHAQSVVIVVHDHMPIAPDAEKMLRGGVTGKVQKLLVDVEIDADIAASAATRDGWKAKALAAIQEVRQAIDADPERLMLALSASDFNRAKREGKAAILLGVEGAKLLEGDVSNLQTFYDLGLRELQLRWAVPNQIVEADELTPLGVEVVRECHRLGVIVDLSHIPTAAFYQTIELARGPVIVSHGTASGASPRAKDHDDDKLKALASSGGLLAIHFYSSYLGPMPTVDRVVEQVDYIAQVAGIGAVALGIDFFPREGKWRDFQVAQGTTDISWAIDDISQVGRVTEALVRRKFSDDDIQSVLGGNFLRVCQEVLRGGT